ncbi:hypothetical protein C4544_04830 [candidate division WS5 bacterium]|uniref:Sulfatase N-terminal domain-containing protein n=1 Tax=candidate division WS5 bacterium TaxID=2093353 RepID=A0A419DC12_9BACT|nr:MAG: hypothetical protein C4544_04830 [candidate division WS5 bacterium]
MSAKKSLLITLRIFFVLFSFVFIRDAFYKWDGYSYYMTFRDFLPDLSLAFIFWTLLGVITSFIFWIVIYGFSKIILRYLKINLFEQLMLLCSIIIVAFILKKTFLDVSLSDVIGLSYYTFITLAGILVLIFCWLTRKLNYEKILLELNSRITLLFWFFILLLILAVPLSALNKQHVDLPPSAYPLHKTEREVIKGELADKKRPNIILVVMDALTARDMQVYGYHRLTTPFISEWAKDAFVFDRSYSTSNWTTPSTMSIMTGQRPWTHRIWHLAENQPVKDYKDSLPRVLKDYGYSVYGFVQNNYAHPRTLGIKDPFLINDDVKTFWISPTWLVDQSVKFYLKRPIVAKWIFIDNPLIVPFNVSLFRFPYYITSIRSEVVYDRFLENIPKATEKPFFAYIHVYPPHFPYMPPDSYIGKFGDVGLLNTAEKQIESNLIGMQYGAEKQKDVDILRKRYDEFILYSDQEFKIFLEKLEDKVNMSNTIIFLLSDHGECFSHGFVSHGEFDLYEPLVHVPLIIKTPWKDKGRIISMPVEQIDIAPTVLEFAGIQVPEWMEGRSLIPMLKGEMLEPKPVISMQLMKNRTIGNYPITKGTIAVWEGNYKLIKYLEENKSLLFDLGSDPDETDNISEKEPEITQRLLKIIGDELSDANNKITRSNMH